MRYDISIYHNSPATCKYYQRRRSTILYYQRLNRIMEKICLHISRYWLKKNVWSSYRLKSMYKLHIIQTHTQQWYIYFSCSRSTDVRLIHREITQQHKRCIYLNYCTRETNHQQILQKYVKLIPSSYPWRDVLVGKSRHQQVMWLPKRDTVVDSKHS